MCPKGSFASEIISHTFCEFTNDSAQAYIFGGELNAWEPRDNDVQVVDLQDGKSW